VLRATECEVLKQVRVADLSGTSILLGHVIEHANVRERQAAVLVNDKRQAVRENEALEGGARSPLSSRGGAGKRGQCLQAGEQH
jgi:hypothetical protein